MVGIVGPSGSGKSTLAKLIQRLYVPESGRVLVDGADLSVVDVSWLRRQVGVVLQENVLFNTSVRDNIAIADPTMPMERVIAAETLAGAAERERNSRRHRPPVMARAAEHFGVHVEPGVKGFVASYLKMDIFGLYLHMMHCSSISHIEK